MVSFAQLAMSISIISKNKSHIQMLKRRGPLIDLCGMPDCQL